MSRFLYRWGHLAATRPWGVLGAWALVVAGVAALLATQTPSIATTLTLDDAPAQEVLDDIAAQLPEAAGTQGVIVFTAPDGGRVDEPARASAIDAALDEALASGIVVDRDARLADERARLESTVRTRVEAGVGDEVATRLEGLLATLEQAREQVPTPGADVPAERRAALTATSARLDDLAARAQALLDADDRTRIEGAGALFADASTLQADLVALGSSGVALPQPDPELSDPVAAVESAVTEGTTAALDRMAALTAGTSPQGEPLRTSDGPRPGVVVSTDGTTAVATLQLTEQASDLPDGALDDLLTGIEDTVAPAGLDAAASSALLPLEAPLGGTEVVGLAVAAVVLLLTLGSLLVAGLPILTALVGVFIGVGGAYALSGNFLMTTSTPALGLMLGLAVGIDYALFLVHKQRSLRSRLRLDPVEATARATATAGGAVLFAGSTVVIALLGLLTLGMGFVTTMALTAAVTVALAVALSLTAVPAFLGLVGARGRAPSHAPTADDVAHHGRFGRAAERWVRIVTARPAATITLVTVALGALAVPAAAMELGMPSGATAEPGSASRIAYDGVSHTMGEGANAPLVVAVTPAEPASVGLDQLETWQVELGDRNGVADVRLMGSSPGSGLVLFTVVPDGSPTDRATADLVTGLRDAELSGVERVGVTGLTALNIDLSSALAEAIPVYVALVAGLSLVVLLLVFRSVVVPLAATAGFLLSIGAAMGLVVAVFGSSDLSWLVGVDRAGPVLSFLPIMATGILYGLAMDYQVFLGTSVREEHVHGTPARRAVVAGFHHASRVVVAAAVIMIAVFGGFVLSTDTTIRQFGFALSAGILIDAFLIRMTFVPAVLHLAGERAWWLPRLLARVLPEVDVEGSRLDRPEAAPGAGEPTPANAGADGVPARETLVR